MFQWREFMVDTKISGLTGGSSYCQPEGAGHASLSSTPLVPRGASASRGEDTALAAHHTPRLQGLRTLKHEPRVEGGRRRRGGRVGPCALLLGGSGHPPQQQRSAAGGGQTPPPSSRDGFRCAGGVPSNVRPLWATANTTLLPSYKKAVTTEPSTESRETTESRDSAGCVRSKEISCGLSYRFPL